MMNEASRPIGVGFWKEHSEGWKASGLTQIEYCARELWAGICTIMATIAIPVKTAKDCESAVPPNDAHMTVISKIKSGNYSIPVVGARFGFCTFTVLGRVEVNSCDDCKNIVSNPTPVVQKIISAKWDNYNLITASCPKPSKK